MLLAAVEQAARALGLPGARVLVAVSGGIDSTVLAHALVALSEPLGFDACIGHVHHGLRGEASDGDAKAVAALAATLGVPFGERRVDPESLRRSASSRARPTLQEAARRVRHDALDEIALELGCGRIAMAHTRDDQAETVLLRLLRGAGPDALGAMAEASPDGRLVRPLLGVTRAEIERFARERCLDWRDDASNRDPRFARARMREGGLAALAAAVNPGWLRAVADLAEAHRRDAEWWDAQVALAAAQTIREEGDTLWIEREPWPALPEAIARRLAREALRRAGGGRDVSRTHLLRMLDFLRDAQTGSVLELPGGLRLRAERRRVALQRRPAGRAGSQC